MYSRLASEDALDIQARQGAHPGQGLQGGVEVGLVALEAQPGHAGVQLDVGFHSAARLDGCVRKGLGGLFAPDILGHPIIQDDLDLIGRGQAQLENRQLNARQTQLPGLIHVGDGQILRAQLRQGAGGLHRAVSVGVRFDHAQKAGVGPHLFAQGVVVVGQRIEIDFRPGTNQCSLHIFNFFRINCCTFLNKVHRIIILITQTPGEPRLFGGLFADTLRNGCGYYTMSRC